MVEIKKNTLKNKKTVPLKKAPLKKAPLKKTPLKKTSKPKPPLKKPALKKVSREVVTKNISQEHKPISKLSFKKRMEEKLTFNNYFDYLLFLFSILVFVIFCNFIIKVAVFSIAPAIIVYYSNYSSYYFWYNFLFILVFLFVYFMFAYEASRINISLNNFFKSVINLSLFLFFLESLLISINYFSFIKTYALLHGISNGMYILYLIFLTFTKYFLLMLFTFVLFYIFEKLKSRF